MRNTFNIERHFLPFVHFITYVNMKMHTCDRINLPKKWHFTICLEAKYAFFFLFPIDCNSECFGLRLNYLRFNG